MIKSTQQQRVLDILLEASGAWIDGMEFLRLDRPITQYHTRIFEPEEKGYMIEHRTIEGKNWKEYRLTAQRQAQLFNLSAPAKQGVTL